MNNVMDWLFYWRESVIFSGIVVVCVGLDIYVIRLVGLVQVLQMGPLAICGATIARSGFRGCKTRSMSSSSQTLACTKVNSTVPVSASSADTLWHSRGDPRRKSLTFQWIIQLRITDAAARSGVHKYHIYIVWSGSTAYGTRASLEAVLGKYSLRFRCICRPVEWWRKCIRRTVRRCITSLIRYFNVIIVIINMKVGR